MDDGESFGRLVKRRRKGLGLTQSELAQQTGYSVSAIRKVESDELRPSQPLANALAQHLNVAPEQVVHFVRFARERLSSDPWKGLDRHGDGVGPPTKLYSGHLPEQLTPLIGREQEIGEALTLLRQNDVRLLVLTGAPGVGKTHLSLRVASDLSTDFRDGVVFVRLAQIDDASLVDRAIAQALGIGETGTRPILESVREQLRDAHLLLVLDNFEQVIAAGPVIADLLAAAPHLKVLVTSREVLRLRGEHDYPVSPLSLPPSSVDDGARGWETVAGSEAVRLFVARAQAARPSFGLTRENAATVATICRDLDGLPLAIELAAARVRVLSPQALLAQLANRLRFLTGGARDLPPHQRTLRGAIGWSYDLLDDHEKKLFRRLAVFAGGCTMEGAERVGLLSCSTVDILDLLTTLVDKSLLRQDEHVGEEPRFTMLESIRQYAREELDLAGEGRDVQKRHLDWFVEWADRAGPELSRANQVEWLNRAEADQNNVRAALTWALANDPAAGLRLLTVFSFFWRRRGNLAEARHWLRVMLASTASDHPEHDSPADRVVRASALHRAGILATVQGDYQSAARSHEASLAIFRQISDTSGVGDALGELGRSLLLAGGDPEEVRQLLEESLSAFRASKEPDGDRWVLGYLGELAMIQRDDRLARAHLATSLAAFRRSGDLRTTNWCQFNLGFLDLLADNPARARPRLTNCLALAVRLGARQDIAVVLLGLARLSDLDGNLPRALAHFRDSARLFREVGSPAVYDTLSFLGELAAKLGDYSRSVRLFAAGSRRQPRYAPIVCSVYSAANHPDWDACLAAARSALGEDEFASDWAEGQAMTLEQAVTYALAESEVEASVE